MKNCNERRTGPHCGPGLFKNRLKSESGWCGQNSKRAADGAAIWTIVCEMAGAGWLNESWARILDFLNPFPGFCSEFLESGISGAPAQIVRAEKVPFFRRGQKEACSWGNFGAGCRDHGDPQSGSARPNGEGVPCGLAGVLRNEVTGRHKRHCDSRRSSVLPPCRGTRAGWVLRLRRRT